MHRIAFHLLRVNRSCRGWKPFLCALILVVSLLTGDWNLPEDGLAEMFQTFELSEFRRYNDLVCWIDRVMLKNRILAESDCEWPLRALGADDNPFPSPCALEIFSRTGGLIRLAADGAGRISFPLRADLRRENPPLRFPDSSFGGVGIQRLIVDNPRLSRLSARGAFADTIFHPWKNAVLEGDGFAVYYPKEMLEPAKQSFQELQKQHDFLSKCLGMELAKFGVNLVSGDSWPSLFSINASASLPGWNQSPNPPRKSLRLTWRLESSDHPNRFRAHNFSCSPGWRANKLVQWINLHK